MPRRTDIKLTRAVIVSAALRVAERSPTSPGLSPTGQSLGDELRVNRSAIWRHFRDKDDLLLAVGDAMVESVVDGIDTAREPADRLRWIWNGTIAAFLRYPHIGEQLGSRFVSGPNALAIVEEILHVMSEFGFSQGEGVAEYRAFADLTFAYATMTAEYSLLDPDVAASDRLRTKIAVGALATDEHPLIAAAVDELVSTPDSVQSLILGNYIAGLELKQSAHIGED